MKKSPWYSEYFVGKKITKMGLGPLGRSFGDIVFLVQAGAVVTVTDLRDGEDVQLSVHRLLDIFTDEEESRVRFVLGKHDVKDFEKADMVLSASAVPLDSPYLAAAKKNKVPVYTSAALLFELIHQKLPDVVTVGVTGSKGKSTTTDMVESIIKAAGNRYHIAGNVRGVANLPVLKKIKDGDIILAELDSWQLQGFGFRKISPKISVFTSFFEDHLNYYKGSMKAYFKDKSYIYKFQKKDDICFVSPQANKEIHHYDTKPVVQQVTQTYIPKAWKTLLIGEHNKQNFALASAVADQLGVLKAVVKSTYATYTAMEGRFKLVAQKKNVYFYDDNNSTIPESTIRNLKTLRDTYKKTKPKIIWLGGGASKSLDYTKFAKDLGSVSDVRIMFAGAATDDIYSKLSAQKQKETYIVHSMKEAFARVKSEITEHVIVILSPAAASFGVFKNEYDRGDQYNKSVKNFKV